MADHSSLGPARARCMVYKLWTVQSRPSTNSLIESLTELLPAPVDPITAMIISFSSNTEPGRFMSEYWRFEEAASDAASGTGGHGARLSLNLAEEPVVTVGVIPPFNFYIKRRSTNM